MLSRTHARWLSGLKARCLHVAECRGAGAASDVQCMQSVKKASDVWNALQSMKLAAMHETGLQDYRKERPSTKAAQSVGWESVPDMVKDSGTRLALVFVRGVVGRPIHKRHVLGKQTCQVWLCAPHCSVPVQGSWVADKRHGLGKQTYAKGDIYEGLWKQDLQDGPG
eukprot:scaffold17561_cov20-Tisochrysis_lutea.AAC.6